MERKKPLLLVFKQSRLARLVLGCSMETKTSLRARRCSLTVDRLEIRDSESPFPACGRRSSRLNHGTEAFTVAESNSSALP